MVDIFLKCQRLYYLLSKLSLVISTFFSLTKDLPGQATFSRTVCLNKACNMSIIGLFILKEEAFCLRASVSSALIN